MYACFLLSPKGWHFSYFVDSVTKAAAFAEQAEDMMSSRLNGVTIIGYDVHELTDLSKIGKPAVEPVP